VAVRIAGSDAVCGEPVCGEQFAVDQRRGRVLIFLANNITGELRLRRQAAPRWGKIVGRRGLKPQPLPPSACRQFLLRPIDNLADKSGGLGVQVARKN